MPQSVPCSRKQVSSGISEILLLLLCLVVLMTGGCAGRKGTAERQDGDKPVRFVLPGGTLANERDILTLTGGADYILVGEQHDNPMDHKAQAALMDLLARKGDVRPMVGLEMLPRRYYDFQLAAFIGGRVRLEELPEALNWKNTWGYDFALYRPVFETAQKHKLAIYGLNLPDAVRRSVSRKGLAGLSEAEKEELPARIIPPQPAQMEKLQAIFRMHGAMGEKHPVVPAGVKMPGTGAEPAKRGIVPAAMRGGMDGGNKEGAGRGPLPTAGKTANALAGRGMLERFVLIQSLWDSTMAEQAVENRKFVRRQMAHGATPAASHLPMLILAGAGHVEYGYGIASRIRAFEPGARTVLVMPFSGALPEPGAADLYYYSEERSHSSYGFTFAMRAGTLTILSVAPGSRAEAAGMRAGDDIVRVGGEIAHSPADMHKAAIQAKRQGQPLRFIVNRKGKEMEVVMPEARTQDGA